MRTLAQLPLSLSDCSRILRDFRADAVFGVGGYASGPAMAAALLRRVPAMAFEPNAIPGMANRLVGKYVQAAAVNFPPAAKWFRNAEVTGIPVRSEFFAVTPPAPASPPHLLIFGGSQGANIFNTLMPPLAKALLNFIPGLTLLHQAGARHADSTRSAYKASGADPSRWRVEAFLDTMADRFAAAHLVMARSGASTVAELAAAGKPALLIPFAAAADGHQRSNAQVMVDSGAAVMLEERQLAEPEILLETLRGLLADPARLRAMGEQARTLARPGAGERIAELLVGLIR
jgi:UDP-N-acetylglucosamine--N-acetylmuramyl-(pentapeptide) pyrophosphoryl-undecaprenol N-acetylglucosamine transferase